MGTSLWWQGRYAYCKLPKELFSDERYRMVSPLAKVLYAFLLDRMSLSHANGEQWMTRQGDYFVYFPITEIMELFDCGRDKASALLKELSDAQLISRTLTGRGRPYRITVNPFHTCRKTPDATCRENRDDDVENPGGNNTKAIHTDVVETESSTQGSRAEWSDIIRENIGYDVLREEIPISQLDGMLNVIVDVLSHECKYVHIFGETIPKNEIQNRFLALNDMHIRYVYYRMTHETQDVQNLRGYILARLYEADDVMDSYFAMQVNRDFMHGKEV